MCALRLGRILCIACEHFELLLSRKECFFPRPLHAALRHPVLLHPFTLDDHRCRRLGILHRAEETAHRRRGGRQSHGR